MPLKKAAKKAPAKSALKHDEGKDLRRVHEHQGRVLALHTAVGKHGADVKTLTELAERELEGSHFKDAADLFRVAEHLSFGMIASEKADADISEALKKSLTEEFENKRGQAAEHWRESATLSALYEKTLDRAQSAFDNGAYRRALELVRAAEALAHVHLHEGEATEDISDESDEN